MMKITHLLVAASVSIFSVTTEAVAQTRNNASGQVPRAYSGQGNPYSGYQPKPTGQIAPAQAGQSPANLPVPPNVSRVQTLGFESTNAGIAPEGQVPKVNVNQDARTFPERYQSTTTPVQQSVTVGSTQMVPGPNGQQYPATNVTVQTQQYDQNGQPITNQQVAGQPLQMNTGQQQATGQQAGQSYQTTTPATGAQQQQRSPSQITPASQQAPATAAPAPGAPRHIQP